MRHRSSQLHVKIAAVSLAALILVGARPLGACEPPWRDGVTVELTDERQLVELDLDSTLVLRVVNVPHADVPSMGWMVEVMRKPVDLESPNLLYHSRYFHGPYPTDFLAWSTREQYFPDSRILEVYETDYEIRGELLEPETTLVGETAVFTRGRLAVSYRRRGDCADED